MEKISRCVQKSRMNNTHRAFQVNNSMIDCLAVLSLNPGTLFVLGAVYYALYYASTLLDLSRFHKLGFSQERTSFLTHQSCPRASRSFTSTSVSPMMGALKSLPSGPRLGSSITAKATATAPAPLTKADVYPKASEATATVSYFEPPANGEAPYVYVYKREDAPQTNFSRTEREVKLYDMRSESFSLPEHGIELHKLKIPSDIDWDNEKEVPWNANVSPPCSLHVCFETCEPLP